ncbi:J-kappa-recombination signal binding protein [Mycena indigotica]|uniref:J-kappa-recombination signal binding protein n=1 Tax=Mycena indigotica TaxID=2126181 RepID=A0A8H6TDV7_9AGAR|nr:J-kappa-recombination signal binding protein [Mycena indigotica]KAF7315484.1 J-kappa-recombination signal binding protein [Mycena indigotica]
MTSTSSSSWDLQGILNPTSRDPKMSALDYPPHDAHHFDNPEGHPFDSNYRTNSSSSSSLAPPRYVDQIYPPSFPDASYQSSNGTYPDLGSLPSYNSGKVSPLTPSFKDYPPNYPDLGSDRRLGSNNYQADFPDEYMPFAGSQFPDRLPPRFPPDHRFNPAPPPMHGSDMVGVAPNAIRGDFRQPPYDDMPHYMSNPELNGARAIDDTLRQMNLQPRPMGGSGDILTFIRHAVFHHFFIQTNCWSDHISNNMFGPPTDSPLASGPSSSCLVRLPRNRMVRKNVTRFLCPPPTAIMIGNSWWNEVIRRGDEPKLCPPRVLISISGEPAPQEGSIEWTSASGKSFDISDPPTGTTYTGRCVGKQLFISDVDEKKKKVEALVRITAPATDEEPERVIGTFPSRPIKVISKPSKKRQSAKNLELCINHGSTISLFHRLRSQTVSTKYLCVSGSGSSFKGSDGAPLTGLDHRTRTNTPSFIARTASWDPFVMYIVDINKPAGGIDAPPPPPPQLDYPSPPPNAVPFANNGSQIPIYYNQTVVLQCLTSGVVSPVLIIRKVDHQTTVVGGGLVEGAKGVADHYCAPGEVCGDPVSQLHKIAFEVYDPARGMPEPGTPGTSGAFLSCMGEKVNTYRPIDGRQWNGISNGTNSPPMPASPLSSGPASAAGSEYFPHSATGSSAPTSPSASPDFLSNDGGRVKKKRGSTSAGGISPINKNGPKGRRRPSSAGSVTSTRRGSSSDGGASSGALWQVDIGETSVWTIVGTDQVRYNFYIPPVLLDSQSASGSYAVPSKPITPFPALVKYLPPDRAAEAPKHHNAGARNVLTKPNPHASKLLTVYGENFSKTDPVSVFFGADPSPYVEIRCNEVLGCLPPEQGSQKRRPLILIRSDGVVFPSNVYYP